MPTHYVDISETFAGKQELLHLHRSQMTHMSRTAGWNLADYSAIVGAFRGLQCGVTYAEAFRPALTWPRFGPSPLPHAATHGDAKQDDVLPRSVMSADKRSS